MHAVCEDFDKYFSAWNQDVYRLCFAMVGKAGDARDLTFKTFLRLGAAKDPEMKEKDAKTCFFQVVLRFASIPSAKRCAACQTAKRLKR